MNCVFHYNEVLPPIISPASLCFTYPSRVADAWEPFAEKVLEDECAIPETSFSMKIFEGSTSELQRSHWVRKRNLLRRLQRLREPIALEGILYDARSAKDLGNVTHFLRGPLTEILFAKKALLNCDDYRGEDLRVLLPSEPPGYACEMLTILGILFVATDREVCGRVVLAHKTDSVSGAAVRHYPLPSLFDHEASSYGLDVPHRIFISRKGSRRIINEAEVEESIAKDGFVKCYFEGMSVREQWNVMRNAKEIVAIHGAALGNLLVHQGWRIGEGPRVVEIFGAGHKAKCFRYYVAALNGRWCSVRSQVTSKIIRDMDENFKKHSHAFDPIMVHPESVRLALEYVRQG